MYCLPLLVHHSTTHVPFDHFLRKGRIRCDKYDLICGVVHVRTMHETRYIRTIEESRSLLEIGNAVTYPNMESCDVPLIIRWNNGVCFLYNSVIKAKRMPNDIGDESKSEYACVIHIVVRWLKNA